MVVALLLAISPGAYAAPQQGGSPVELGYSPGSLLPLTQGVPVYTVGDQLWLSSGYNISLSAAVFPPGAQSPVSVVPVASRSIQDVYTFTNSDQSGQWNLVLVSGTLPIQVIPFNFERPPAVAPPSLSSTTLLPNGSLLANFNMSLGEGYSGQTCLVGSSVPTAVSFPFPAGGGEVSLSANGTTITAQSYPTGVTASRGSTMDFWLELYYPYSYTQSSSLSQIVTREVLVARTDPIIVNSSIQSNSTLELTEFAHLRAGRYYMAAYFRDSSGLTAREASVLWSGAGKWVWLGGCLGAEPLTSSFSYKVPLTGPPSSWPSGIYAMLDVGGVEGGVFSSIPVDLAAVRLTTGAWTAPFPHYLTVSAAPSPELKDSAAVNGTVYLVLNSIPAEVNVLVGSAGSRAENVTVGIASSGSQVSIPVSLGRLSVKVETNGAGVSGAVLKLSAGPPGGKSPVSGVTDAQGLDSFLLVPGNYTLAYLYKNMTRTVSVDVSPDVVSQVYAEIPFTPDYTIPYVLLTLGAIGAGVNFFVWRRVLRAR